MNRNNISTVEHLPNEILLEIFKYANFSERLLAWYNLNKRLNKLFEEFHFLDLSNVSYSYIVVHSTLIANLQHRILSLKASNIDTADQISFFFARFPLEKFGHLQLLSLIKIKNVELNEIISKVPSLNHLSYLSIDCHKEYDEEYVINNIISTSLRSLIISTTKAIDYNWSNIGMLCPNLISLKIDFFLYIYQFVQLLSSVANSLRNLSILLRGNDNYCKTIPVIDLSDLNMHINIEQLSISLKENLSFNDFKLIIKQFKLLRKLTMEMNLCWNINAIESPLNGFEWEQLISGHFPDLTKFNLCIKAPGKLWNDQVSHSFESDFWINHRWSVGFECYMLSTVPCMKKELTLNVSDVEASFLLSSGILNRYDCIHTLSLEFGTQFQRIDKTVRSVLFPNVIHLTLSFTNEYISDYDYDDDSMDCNIIHVHLDIDAYGPVCKFLRQIVSLSKLQSLTVCKLLPEKYFARLLRRMPNLTKLKINDWEGDKDIRGNALVNFMFENKNLFRNIQHLTISGIFDGTITINNVEVFIHTLNNCQSLQILHIEVNDQDFFSVVLLLLREMNSLTFLSIESYILRENIEEILEWLQEILIGIQYRISVNRGVLSISF